MQEYRQAPRLLGGLVPTTVGYAATGLETRIHRGLPSPYLTFIFSLDGPVVTGETEDQAFGADAQRHDVLIGGLASRPAYVVQPATQAGVQLVQSYLRSRVDTRRLGPPRPELVAAWRWMARSGGSGSMDGLSQHVGLSARQLRSVFGGELGMSPKQVSQLMRFDRAKQLITDAVGMGARLDLTSIGTSPR